VRELHWPETVLGRLLPVFQHKRPLHTRLVVAETAVEADEGPHGQRWLMSAGSAMASASAMHPACCNAGSHTPSFDLGEGQHHPHDDQHGRRARRVVDRLGENVDSLCVALVCMTITEYPNFISARIGPGGIAAIPGSMTTRARPHRPSAGGALRPRNRRIGVSPPKPIANRAIRRPPRGPARPHHRGSLVQRIQRA